jgi:hypothetical protein
MGTLNRNQAIANAITNKLIDVDDDGHAEHMSAKLNATRKNSVPTARSVAGTAVARHSETAQSLP